MIFHLNQSSGIPVYLQLMEQIKYGVATGALQEGDRLPTIRKLAADLVINPNTVVRAYRDLQHEGVVELRQGSGAYVRGSRVERGRVMQKAGKLTKGLVERLSELGLSEQEIRRIVESELSALGRAKSESEVA